MQTHPRAQDLITHVLGPVADAQERLWLAADFPGISPEMREQLLTAIKHLDAAYKDVSDLT